MTVVMLTVGVGRTPGLIGARPNKKPQPCGGGFPIQLI
ncbi:hypothetical protein SynA1528_01578 [Synechococcus sp. A15-28]|nr:hypothetical protein SynA1528_01578 [Synechococcus sp. A15-28]